MEAPLHCNNLQCRALCEDRAVTTTCSHIFCLACAERLNIGHPREGQRKCPACKAPLNAAEDAVTVRLNPSEAFKASVLAGLSPTIIMEITSRGLQFWNYQMAQEITYQDLLARNLTERYHTAKMQLDSTIKNAETETSTLTLKLQDALEQLEQMHEKHDKLVNAYKEKSRSQQQIQKLYQALKHQQLAAGMELAAGQDVDQFLHDPLVGQHADPHLPVRAAQEMRAGVTGHGYGMPSRPSLVDRWAGNPGAGIDRSESRAQGTPAKQSGSMQFPAPVSSRLNTGNANVGYGMGNDSIRRGGVSSVRNPFSMNGLGSPYPQNNTRAGSMLQEPVGGRARVAAVRPSGMPGMMHVR